MLIKGAATLDCKLGVIQVPPTFRPGIKIQGDVPMCGKKIWLQRYNGAHYWYAVGEPNQ